MNARAERARSPEQESWLRTLSVLSRPRAAFAALRDDSDQAAALRQDPLFLTAFLAGVSFFLSTTTAGRLYDDYEFDALLILVQTIVAGAIVAIQYYWLGGGALYVGLRGMGSEGSYRQARHVLALAMVPLVVSLVLVWPVRLAVFGGDLFRSGGADAGTGGDVFRGLDAAFGAWALALLLLGVRTVYEWSWARTLAAVSLTALLAALVGVAAVVL